MVCLHSSAFSSGLWLNREWCVALIDNNFFFGPPPPQPSPAHSVRHGTLWLTRPSFLRFTPVSEAPKSIFPFSPRFLFYFSPPTFYLPFIFPFFRSFILKPRRLQLCSSSSRGVILFHWDFVERIQETLGFTLRTDYYLNRLRNEHKRCSTTSIRPCRPHRRLSRPRPSLMALPTTCLCAARSKKLLRFISLIRL